MTTVETKKDEKPDYMGCLTALALSPFRTIFTGVVLRSMYEWFIREPFPSAPALTMFQLLGISMLFSFVTFRTDLASEKQSIAMRISIVFMFPLLIWLFAWLIHFLISKGY